MPINSPLTSTPVFVSDTYRQKLLIAYTDAGHPESEIIAWSLYDGSAQYEFEASDLAEKNEAPYANIVEAMRDGWRVFQVPRMENGHAGNAHQLGVLPYEWCLEQWEIIND